MLIFSIGSLLFLLFISHPGASPSSADQGSVDPWGEHSAVRPPGPVVPRKRVPAIYKEPVASLKFVAGQLGQWQRSVSSRRRGPKRFGNSGLTSIGRGPQGLGRGLPGYRPSMPSLGGQFAQPGIKDAGLDPFVKQHLSKADLELFAKKKHLVQQVYYKILVSSQKVGTGAGRPIAYVCKSFSVRGRNITLAKVQTGIPFDTDLNMRTGMPEIPMLTLPRPMAGDAGKFQIKAIAIVKLATPIGVAR